MLNSTRSTDFITPKSEVSKDFRNAVLSLAGTHGFARLLVNSGRLSVPAHLVDSPLNTPDNATFEGRLQPGAPVADAPVQHEGQDSWLLNHVGGSFSLLLFVESAEALDAVARAEVAALAAGPIPARTLLVTKQPGAAPPGCTLVVDHQGAAWRSTTKAWQRSASTRCPAPLTCCAPTSMWLGAGVRWLTAW